MDMNQKLFIDSSGKEYTTRDVYEALLSVGADKCDTLFVHSEIMFGNLFPGIKRKVYMESLLSAIEALNVKNVIFPTFTYSFCNSEDYSVNDSKTYVGALNEFVRNKPNRYRTMDPLLSLSVPESIKSLFEACSEHSLGLGSGLDVIHNIGNVKFLFLGARLGNCFTYVHYIEKIREVPYRFDMGFSGNIIDAEGCITNKKQFIHTACYGVKPADYYYFEDYLEKENMLKKVPLGDRFVSCISESDAYSEINKMLDKDINYFLEKPFTEADLEHKYTKGIDGERITHC